MKIHATLDFPEANWCLFLFAFSLVARKTNLLPSNISDIVKGNI